ncbi:MAG: hypothetical protein FWC82_00800 [Firmicutes bacterium]|nr:hypothetical protein [Bacillota bacterium]
MEDKFATREYPKSNTQEEITRPKYKLSTKTQSRESKDESNKFARAMKFIFVKNIGLKIAAIVTAGVLWAITVGFS